MIDHIPIPPKYLKNVKIEKELFSRTTKNFVAHSGKW